MTPRERLYNTIEGKPVDRLPNLNIVMQLAAQDIGSSYADFCRDGLTLARGMIAAAENYGLDFVSAISDPMREAHDLGSTLAFPENGVPYAPSPLLGEVEDLAKLKHVKPEDGRRMADRLLAIRTMSERVGSDYPVIGWVEGCFALSADLRGVNEFLFDLYDNPQFVDNLLEFTLEQATLFAKAQIAAGADIIGVGDAIASVAGPTFYKSHARQYQSRLLSAIRDAGARTKLHICGNTTPFLAQLPIEHIDILDLDWMVPLDEAAQLHGDSVVLCGNYDPVAVLLDGTNASIDRAVRHCAAVSQGKKYASAAGCEVPRDINRDHFKQVARTLKQIGA